MKNKFAKGIVYALFAFPAGALLGYALITLLSGNTHDLPVESAMTAIFVAGPLAAIVAFVVGLSRKR
ncbi:hypothetical protein [Mesorhizobium sp. NBSH29]|uniref:hypothetical protein n=1 Tax=Mesorhizobium sp. NBSH29 TaxID=2654249 RepID=UPI0018966306|nr:hypothetical protein [Mesorhizobium sp. NBSH29]